MHELYAASRGRTYTQITLYVLRGNGVNLNLTPLVPVRLERSYFGANPCRSNHTKGRAWCLRNTVKSVHDQHRAGKDLVILGITGCKTSSNVLEVLRWDSVPDEDSSGTDDLTKVSYNCHLVPSSECTCTKGDLNYPMMFISEMGSTIVRMI